MSSRKGWQLPTFAGSGLVQCMCTHLANPYVATWLDLQCCICLGDFEDGEQLRVLGCKHGFHMDCVDEWLLAQLQPLATTVIDVARESSKRIYPKICTVTHRYKLKSLGT